MSHDLKAIGERVLALRRRRGDSGRAFAHQMGVAQSQLSQVERGLVRPSWELLDALYTQMNISIDWLLSGEGPMFLSGGLTQRESSPLEQVNDIASRVMTLQARLLSMTEEQGHMAPEDGREGLAVARLREIYQRRDPYPIRMVEGLLGLPPHDDEDFSSVATPQAAKKAQAS